MVKRKLLKEAPNPNPVSTAKIKEQESKLQEESKKIDNALNEIRPDLSTEGLVDKITKIEENNETTHKDNLRIIEEKNGTKDEIKTEKALYKTKQDALAGAKKDLEGVIAETGKQREKARKTLEGKLAPKAQSESKTAAAKSFIKGTTTSSIVKGAVTLSENAVSKPAAERLALKLKETSVGIGEFLSSTLSPASAKFAIDNVINSIEGNKKLTDAEKKTLVDQLRKETPKQLPNQNSPTEKSYLDDGDIQAIDDAQYQDDTTEALDGGFAEATKNTKETKDLKRDDIKEQNEADASTARETYNGFIDRTQAWIAKNWVGRALNNSPLLRMVKRIPAKRIHEILASSFVGGKTESFTFENAVSTSLLTRVGRNAYEYLKARGEDVSAFETLPSALHDAAVSSGMSKEEILQRAISFRSIKVGGEMMRFVGGVEGFFEYERGFPQLSKNKEGKRVNSRPQDLTIEVKNLRSFRRIKARKWNIFNRCFK